MHDGTQRMQFLYGYFPERLIIDRNDVLLLWARYRDVVQPLITWRNIPKKAFDDHDARRSAEINLLHRHRFHVPIVNDKRRLIHNDRRNKIAPKIEGGVTVFV